MSRIEGVYNKAASNGAAVIHIDDLVDEKEEAYRELEDMVTEALKFMDANDITIFELEINSPQRKKSWKLTAWEEKDICGRYKCEEETE